MRRIAVGSLAACCCSVLAAQQPASVRHEGRVCDARGEPVPAAEVRAVRLGDGAVVARAVSDAEGLWLLPRLPAGVRVALEARAPGKAMTRLSPSMARLASTLEFTLVDAGTLAGRVMDVDGRPIASALVVVVAGQRSAQVATDAQGRYRITDVPVGPLVLRAWAQGHESRFESALLAGEDTKDLRLRAAHAAPRLVRVVGAPGATLTRVQIDVVAPTEAMPTALSALSPDADGRVEVWPVRGTHAVFCRAPGCVSTPTGFVSDGSEREMVFHLAPEAPAPAPSTPVEGRVVDAAGRALCGREVVCANLLGGLCAVATTGAEGRFAIAPALIRDSPGRLALQVDDVRLPGAVDDEGLVWTRTEVGFAGAELHCARGCRIAGRLADGRGEALALAPVWLLQRAPEWTSAAACERHLLSDRNGMVDLRGVLPGDYTLVITAAHTVAFAEFTVGNPSTTSQMPLPKLRFCATGALEGTLRDARGRPLPGHRLVVHSIDWFEDLEPWWRSAGVDFIQEVWTDRDGRFRANGLPPGHWSVSGPAQGEADVAAGRTAAVDLQIR